MRCSRTSATSGERHADVEAPAPAQPGGVDDDAADQRAADGGDRHDAAEQPEYRPRSRGLIIAAIAICTRACRPPRPRPWSTRQAMSVSTDWREPGQHRADDEDDDRELDQQLLAEQVGELAPDRGGGRRGQQGGGDDPGVLGLGAAQVGDDRGQGVGDDRSRTGTRRTSPASGRTAPPGSGGGSCAPCCSAGASGPAGRRCWSCVLLDCCVGRFVPGGGTARRRVTAGRRRSGGPSGGAGTADLEVGAEAVEQVGQPAGVVLVPAGERGQAPSRRAWRGSRRGPRRRRAVSRSRVARPSRGSGRRST